MHDSSEKGAVKVKAAFKALSVFGTLERFKRGIYLGALAREGEGKGGGGVD